MSAEPTPTDPGPQAIADAQRVIGELYATITQLNFEASDAVNPEHLTVQLERAIDAQLAAYQGNPIIDLLRDKAKAAFHHAVIGKLGIPTP